MRDEGLKKKLSTESDYLIQIYMVRFAVKEFFVINTGRGITFLFWLYNGSETL